MGANKLLAPQSDKLLENYFDFHPDIIIESTNACNRACKGCYAANILVGKNSKLSAEFIDAKVLNSTLEQVEKLNTISIRGGEPSIHPQISQVLEVAARYSEQVILETHGRWIEPGSPLLAACKDLSVTIKVSFDSMHGLSISELFELTELLNANSIKFLVAITEGSCIDFISSRKKCPWLADKQIIFQKKSRTIEGLIEPRLGVIKIDGAINRRLSTKTSFLTGGTND